MIGIYVSYCLYCLEYFVKCIWMFVDKNVRMKSVFHGQSRFVEFRNKLQNIIITPLLSLSVSGESSYRSFFLPFFNLVFLLSTSCHSVLILLLLSPTSPYLRSHFYLWHFISLLQIPILSSQLLSQPLHPANNLSFPLKDIIFLILLSRILSYVSWIYASGQKRNWLVKGKVF